MMSLNTPQRLRVEGHISEVITAARLLEHAYEDGDATIDRNEDRLDDAILAYVKARGRG